jgi:hypothetical protein
MTMKKIAKTKLAFTAQTVRTLSATDLGRVGGGYVAGGGAPRPCTNAGSGCLVVSGMSYGCDGFSADCVMG